MLKYLIVQLDDSSVSFCHYSNDRTTRNLMPLDMLKEAIFWSMKENLTLQFLYPDYELPMEYKELISKTFHANIISSTCEDDKLRERADVVVFDSLAAINFYPFIQEQAYVFRSILSEILPNVGMLYSVLPKVNRINIVITDVPDFSDEDMERYKLFLEDLSCKVVEEYKKGHELQINLLTDRMFLDNMNNCSAGDESITLCPDGKFYICPAFYADKRDGYSVGSVGEGLNVKNPQLYKLDHAPICRICDAYHCRRCIWLNRKLTLEVNTPGREQCIMAHIERNASRSLLDKIRAIGKFLPGKEIPELDYLDPFETIIKN